MPAKKRYTTEQIVAKLREAEKLQAQGSTIPQLCKRLGISEQTFYRWRIKYGALKEDEAQRLKALEAENARLKRIVGRAGSGHLDVEGLAEGKLVSPARRRAAVEFLIRRHQVSERRACKVVGQHRSSQRYVAVPSDFEARLVKAMHVLADRHPRYGYRRIHALLVAEGWAVNVKRVERLWRLEGLHVPPSRSKDSGQKARGVDENSAWALPAVRPMHVWSYDFVTARLDNGAAVRILNIVDEHTKVAPGSLVASSIGAEQIIAHLGQLFAAHGKPKMIRSDNGREFIADTVRAWLARQGVEAVFIAKASPQQNCYVERFNRSMRDELLHLETFRSLTEARVVIAEWIREYNELRPHRSLGMKTPAAYAAYCAEHPPAADVGCEF